MYQKDLFDFNNEIIKTYTIHLDGQVFYNQDVNMNCNFQGNTILIN